MARAVKCRCADPTAVALLARISDKDKQTQASIEVQLRETREKLVQPAGLRVVGEYTIKHRGSDLASDANYMTMIADARAGKFARLFVHKFDRLARKAYDRELYWHILTRECGIDVRAALEPYDLATRAGQLTKKTSEFVADLFLDNLREEVLKGMKQKLLAGEWVARAPFGYVNRREEVSHGKMRRWVEVDPIHGSTVTIAFRRWETGDYVLDSLAEWLNSQGYWWEKGLAWNRGRVHRLLTNPFYTGRLIWNGIEAQGVHELLITPETFEHCQAILREHDCDKERGHRYIYALNRLLWFEELGCGSHAEYQAHVETGYYRSRKPGPEGSKIYLRCELVDDQIPAILTGISVPAAAPARIIEIARAGQADTPDPSRLEATRLERRLAELEQERRGYIRLAAQGKIDDTTLNEELARVAAAIGLAQVGLASLQKSGQSGLSDMELALAASRHLAGLWGRADTARRRELARLLFKRIQVDNAGVVVGYLLTEPVEAMKEGPAPISKLIREVSAGRGVTHEDLLEELESEDATRENGQDPTTEEQ